MNKARQVDHSVYIMCHVHCTVNTTIITCDRCRGCIVREVCNKRGPIGRRGRQKNNDNYNIRTCRTMLQVTGEYLY